jgi:hypothetical protein
MRIIRLFALLVAVQALALAQLDPDTLTINVTRNVLLQPDQVGINVFVNAPANSSLDDVLAALPGTGLTAANLISASASGLNGQATTEWSFSLAVPLAKLKDALAALQNAKDNSTVDVTFFTTFELQTSPELLASQTCPYASLVSYAKTQAQKVAVAAGVNVGPIVGVSDSPGGSVPTAIAYAVLASPFGVLSDFLLGSPSPGRTASCSMSVQFKLVH